ncbi:hypothetical protein UVI_02005320 [Ustilaginoidea virens]|uniref:Gelsolin n=1 Tax=Ustilaginoidea virens TaxID=1159556 RepID=A0A1B5KXR0_USTVR|nr:hypothetical protein UVI_02005320 [Ustilaginoidea virens]
MSDEVSQFLEQVERLRGQQIEDDEARAREREEFLAAKRERQARREERARSISPQKSSPANTPSPRSNRQSVHVSDSTRLGSPIRTSEASHISASTSVEQQTSPMLTGSLPAGEKETSVEAEANHRQSPTSPAKTPTLSWQQRRPPSRGAARPLSMVAAQNATQRSLAETQGPASVTEESVGKDQIARALGSKDPSWFRQTPDRGQGSAAYRRHQVEDEDRLDMTSVGAQLPGLSIIDATSENSSERNHGLEAPPNSKLASPATLSSPPRFDGASDRPEEPRELPALSERGSPTRSPSPTKGLGGFVQSAMMKRSDSVKRWSVASPPGLTRAGSVAATRGNYDRSSAHKGARQPDTAGGSSATPTSSRPTSQHGEKQPEIGEVSKSSTQGSKASTIRETEREEGEGGGKVEDEEASVPTSPSKTMDPRRWSPTKSSWLESALKRPESPKQSPTAPSQPMWRDKAAMESNRPTSVSHKHQVSIGGLMRESALGNVAKSNPTGLGGIYSPPANANRPAFGHGSKPSASHKPAGSDLAKIESEGKSEANLEKPAVQETKRTPTMSPPPIKPKPQTPPLKDFRSSLRQRPKEKEAPKSDEPEFKNVFGNLRRTKTLNYVASDELKSNILRGKAALNITDGPRKSEKKDEFKDAILKKKADFKTAQAEGRGVSRTPTPAAERPVPEGLARRAELGKPMTAAAKGSPVSEAHAATPAAKADSPLPIPGPKRIPSGSAVSARSPNAVQVPAQSPSGDKLRRASTEPPSERVKSEPSKPANLPSEASRPLKLQAQVQAGPGGGKLANRFNPALAGLLAKGPPAMSVNGGRGTDDSGESARPRAGESAEPSVPGPQLTHMTKNRARGPRRKAPTGSMAGPSAFPSQVASKQPSFTQTESRVQEKMPEPEAEGESSALSDKTAVEAATTTITTTTATTLEQKQASLPIQQQVAAKATLRGRPLPSPVPGKESFESAKANTSAAPQISTRREQASEAAKMALSCSVKVSPEAENDTAPESSPKRLNVRRMSRFLDETSSKEAEQELARRLEQQRTGSRSPTKLVEPPSPAKSDRDCLPSMREPSPLFGVPSSPVSKSPFDKPATSGGLSRRSRPISGLSTGGLKSPSTIPSPARSPTKQAQEVFVILTDFFGPRRTRQALKVDAAQILMNRPETGGKVTSLGFQLFRVLGDGKKLPVAPQHERVLFDQEMYVCSHHSTDAAGKKSFEIYFWVGDEVAKPAAEDAQLFVQREARSVGGKLVRLVQGKETAEFVQALGGVIIVRKGSSNRFDSLATSMLCGRRYLGQVAFDEVDYGPGSLCSGFTYLITKGGSCYMWNGKGSDVAEVSCARLVGMDLTLTGELVEYEDGSEPPSFWDLFEDEGSRPHSADHWRLKPSYDKYCSRLFCSDADTRQQIFEISPFNQDDLSSEGIYILDAFFEIYVIVGSRAGSQYASFCNALDFAHEYGILASGMEDRPFVPVSTVVLEGIPRDLKRVFRKWDDGKSPTVTVKPTGTGLKRGKSLRVVTLTQALQALRE